MTNVIAEWGERRKVPRWEQTGAVFGVGVLPVERRVPAPFNIPLMAALREDRRS